MSEELVEVGVDSIRVHVQTGQHVVILKEKSADRYLPIWIGPFEANAIALKITGQNPERPITHDLMLTAMTEFDVVVKRVVVTSLAGDVFFARLHVEQGGRATDLDSRPSDAIALAVRFECPIFVSLEVLDQAGVIPEHDDDESGPGGQRTELDEDRLAVFRDLVNNLDLPELPDEPGSSRS